jgi:hypothetical protein
LVGRRPIPGLLVLGCLGITVRTVIYLLSGNAFVYLVRPILRTLVTAATFAISIGVGRPLVARFARDVCPLGEDIQARPAIARCLPVSYSVRTARAEGLAASIEPNGSLRAYVMPRTQPPPSVRPAAVAS